jgi:hypothetical protein
VGNDAPITPGRSLNFGNAGRNSDTGALVVNSVPSVVGIPAPAQTWWQWARGKPAVAPISALTVPKSVAPVVPAAQVGLGARIGNGIMHPVATLGAAGRGIRQGASWVVGRPRAIAQTANTVRHSSAWSKFGLVATTAAVAGTVAEQGARGQIVENFFF